MCDETYLMSSINLFVAQDLTKHIDFLIMLVVGSYAMVKIYLCYMHVQQKEALPDRSSSFYISLNTALGWYATMLCLSDCFNSGVIIIT